MYTIISTVAYYGEGLEDFVKQKLNYIRTYIFTSILKIKFNHL